MGGADPSEAGEGETNGLAIASVLLGVFWLFGAGSVAAIVLGWRSLRQIRESGGVEGGRTIALAGIGIGLAGLGGSALLVAFLVASSHH